MLQHATDASQRMAEAWNNLVGDDLFRSSVYIDDDGVGQLDVLVDEYQAHRLDDLEHDSHEFVDALLECARQALLAAQRCVSGVLRPPSDERLPCFPLFDSASEFFEYVGSGALSGLRPDQIQLVEQFQPYYRSAANDDDAHRLLRAALTRLSQLANKRTRNERPIVAFWAHSADPMVAVDPPAVVTELQPQPDGVLVDWHRVITFQVPPGATGVRANPNIAFDPILHAEPWPDHPDENMSVQSRALLRVVEELLCALERSVGLREPLRERYFRLLPLEDDPGWARIDTSDAPEIVAGIGESDLGLATYRSGTELIMLVQRPDGIYGRIVPAAEPLNQDEERGSAAEDATRNSASRWGLPDFVLQPETVQRGNATREVGDGTIVCGPRGLAVQVKARTDATDRADRERSWISKKAREGARQAGGSVRTVQRSPLTHTNARGRCIVVDGSAVEWVGVVIIDHDAPPDELSVYGQTLRIPYVVVLRREWDFLFDQLRSTTAVVDYFHRIAPHQTTPGQHVARYYELALADEQSPPDLAGSHIPISLDDPALRASHPQLPIEPASAADEYGARTYRQLLEDIAQSPWDHNESDRVNVLYLLDKLPVSERAAMGRRLLTHMGRTPRVEPGTTHWEFRRYLLGNTHLHLAYAVCNQFTDLHKEAFRQWVMLRHHEWTTELEPSSRDDAPTVAVMLTPRYDRVRPWDTTVFAAFGGLVFDQGDLESMRRLWNSPPNTEPDSGSR